MTTTTQPPLTLGDETWGDKFYRAYRRARLHWGRGMTLENLADAVSRFKKVTDSTIIRYGGTDRDEPRQEDSKVNVYLSLVAMGFDPAEFGLTADNVPGIRVFEASGLLGELHPSVWVNSVEPGEDDAPAPKRPVKARKAPATRSRRRPASSGWKSGTAGQRPEKTGPGRKRAA